MAIPEIVFYILSFIAGGIVGALAVVKYMQYKAKKQMEQMQEQMTGMFGGED